MKPSKLAGWRGDEPLDGRVDSALAKLCEKTPELRDVIRQFPFENCIEGLPLYDSHMSYAQLKPFLARLTTDLNSEIDSHLTLKYGLALLAVLIRDRESRWRELSLSPDLKPEFIDSFHRILTAVSRGGNRTLSPDMDAYAKELAICLYRLIPAGGQMIDPGSGIPRRIFLGQPMRERLSVLFSVLRNSHGFAPFAEFHTNMFMRHWFTQEGWEYSFHLLPAIFDSYPKLKGLIAGSWFFDPTVARISPELSFIRKVSSQWGGHLLPGSEKINELDAIGTSKHRRDLFESGEYRPRQYIMIVSKRDVLMRV